VWQPHSILGGGAVDAALFQLFGHMHKRATAFQIDYVHGGACSVSGKACGRDGDCACKPWQTGCTPGQTCVRTAGAEDTTIYYTSAWDLAPIVNFDAPYFRVGRDDGLRWSCTHTNGVQGDPTRPPKKCGEGCVACGWDPPSGTCHFCKTLEQPWLQWDSTAQVCTAGGQQYPSVTPRIFAKDEPMPLVFGLLADDDMCNMFGYFINQASLSMLP
jgi:hypothetical protein